MTLTKRRANYIWYCMHNHSDFVYFRDDWLDGCGISKEEMDAFEELVQSSIESITAES